MQFTVSEYQNNCVKSRATENHWHNRCDQLPEVIQSRWKYWIPNYSIEEMIAWTSSFPWKCKLSCSAPQGTGRVMVLWNGTRSWSAIPDCKGSGRFSEESVYCSLQLWMQYSLQPVLWKPNALQTKSTSTKPMQKFGTFWCCVCSEFLGFVSAF